MPDIHSPELRLLPRFRHLLISVYLCLKQVKKDRRQILFTTNWIAEVGCDILVSGGTLYYEINRAYGKETVQLLEGMGYQSVELRKDMFGDDRMIKAFRP
jgi:methylase of polypeptide subunit release factors